MDRTLSKKRRLQRVEEVIKEVSVLNKHDTKHLLHIYLDIYCDFYCCKFCDSNLKCWDVFSFVLKTHILNAYIRFTIYVLEKNLKY